MRADWKARAASMRRSGLGMPTMDSVGTATAEALCAAMPLAPAPQARLQSYTQKAGEALAQRDAAKHHIA